MLYFSTCVLYYLLHINALYGFDCQVLKAAFLMQPGKKSALIKSILILNY